MVLVFSLLGTNALIALIAFVWLAMRTPGAMRRWGSTCVLVVSHTQTFGLLARLQLEWPPAVRELMSALSLNIGWMRPECMARRDGGDRFFFWYALVMCTAAVTLQLAPQVVVCMCRQRRSAAMHTRRQDGVRAAFGLSLIFALLFISTLGIAMELGGRLAQATQWFSRPTATPTVDARSEPPVSQLRRRLEICDNTCEDPHSCQGVEALCPRGHANNGICEDDGPGVDELHIAALWAPTAPAVRG
jgi:hypothetical protein